MNWQIRNLTIGYKHPLLEVKELVLEENSCIALIGENGKGKSSFLRCIAGIDKPLEGDINMPSVYRGALGFVSTFRPQEDYLSVQDYLCFGFADKLPEQTFMLMDQLKLKLGMNDEVASLSDGQFRRLSMLRQLQKDPKVILLDEPSAYLDRVNKSILIDLIVELKKSKIIVVTSHDFEFLKAVADRVYEIKNQSLNEHTVNGL